MFLPFRIGREVGLDVMNAGKMAGDIDKDKAFQ